MKNYNMFNVKCNYQVNINKENEFIAKVSEKEMICVETVNAYGYRFNDLNELVNLINEKTGKTHHHPLTGPIYIENANPGDVLKVHIHQIKTEEMAQSLSRTAGIDPLDNSNVADRIPIISERISKQEISYCNGIKLPYRPTIGMIATTPEEENIKTGHAKIKNGGNLDIPFITEGTDIYLPVDIEGAGLYLGDVHGLQGYGELSGIAMEASSKIILEVEILKPREKLENILVIGKEPFSGRECVGIIGIGEKESLEGAVKDSFEGSYKLVQKLMPSMSSNIVKSVITLIGNSFNGQAFSKTSESTSIIIITKEDIGKIIKKTIRNFNQELENILFEK